MVLVLFVLLAIAIFGSIGYALVNRVRTRETGAKRLASGAGMAGGLALGLSSWRASDRLQGAGWALFALLTGLAFWAAHRERNLGGQTTKRRT